jgi:outer membrane protein TolC
MEQRRHVQPKRLILICAVVVCLLVGGRPSACQELAGIEKAAAETTKPESTESGDSEAVHNINKILDLRNLGLHSQLDISAFRPIRLEVKYDQPVTLEEVLRYAIDNNLPIKISKENQNYQRCILLSEAAGTLPSFSMAYNLTKTNIFNENISSLARVFFPQVTYPVFRGGSVLYGILGQYYRERGWRQAYFASINDALLDVYQKYYNLLLNRVLLQIRAKSVEVSQDLLKINEAQEKAGTGTIFAVKQSKTQLAADKQALVQQQVALRQAALALNFSLNCPMAVNLVPVEDTVSEKPLFQIQASIDELIDLALKCRPELREYDLFKFAAARNVQVASAPLYPQLTFFNQYSYTNTTLSGPGVSANTAGAGVFSGLFKTYQEGFGLVWNLNGCGLVSAANIAGAQSLNRQAMVQANQEFQTILQQVRTSYLSWRAAREQIDNSADGVRSAKEELDLATLRLRVGVGTNLELIQAQRDYINALSTQAQAIVGSNQAQAQLLHDTGLISTETLLHGYKGGAN